MNQFDSEVLQSELNKNIRPDEATGTVDITYPLVTKGGDQVEVSAGWGQSGVVGKASLKFTNFSMQNLFGNNGYKRAGFIPQGACPNPPTYCANQRALLPELLAPVHRSVVRRKATQSVLCLALLFPTERRVLTLLYRQQYLYSSLYGYGSSQYYTTTRDYLDPDKYIPTLRCQRRFR